MDTNTQSVAKLTYDHLPTEIRQQILGSVLRAGSPLVAPIQSRRPIHGRRSHRAKEDAVGASAVKDARSLLRVDKRTHAEMKFVLAQVSSEFNREVQDWQNVLSSRLCVFKIYEEKLLQVLISPPDPGNPLAEFHKAFAQGCLELAYSRLLNAPAHIGYGCLLIRPPFDDREALLYELASKAARDFQAAESKRGQYVQSYWTAAHLSTMAQQLHAHDQAEELRPAI